MTRPQPAVMCASLLLAALLACSLTFVSATLPYSYDLSTEGVSCSASHVKSGAAALNVQLDAWGDDSVRVRISPDSIFIPPVQGLLPYPPSLSDPSRCIPGEQQQQAEGEQAIVASLVNSNLMVKVAADGSVSAVRLSDGLPILTSAAPSFTPYSIASAFPSPYSLYAVSWQAQHAPGYVYGLGEHQYEADRDNALPYTDFSLLIEESEEYGHSRGGDIFIPWYVSQRGFGVLLNHPGFGFIRIGNESADWQFNATHQLDLWLTTSSADSTARTPYPQLMSRFADVTGHSNPLPHWASGFWQSKDRYRNQSEILGVAEGYHNRSIPVSVIVIDYLHWPAFGDWRFVTECWPDPAGMVREFESFGMRTLLSIWPIVQQESVNFPVMNTSGLLTHGADGKTLVELGGEYLYDAFNPIARDFLWQAVVQGYLQYGIKLYWLDESEPDFSLPGLQYWYGHTDREVALAWSVYHRQGFFDGLVSARVPLDEIVLLSRSTWLGHAAMNVVTWSGDTFNTFDALRHQIFIAQNSQLSGIYWWTSDIGGYVGGDLTDPVFQELLVRWFQFGAFTPIFRIHGQRHPNEEPTDCGGGGGHNEVWTFTYSEEIEAVMQLRESIRPYVEHHLLLTSQTGTPILTPMFYHYPDTACYAAQDQFAFGTDYVVAPVYVYQATSRDVYLPVLPTGQVWVHVYTGQTYVGGKRYTIATTLADFPLFQRQMTAGKSAETQTE